MVGSGSLHHLAPVVAALLVLGCTLLCLSDKGVQALSKPAGLKLGGWQPIKDLNDPHVREIGEFAVSEHNKEVEHDQKLSLRRVVRGETQVVAGINYHLLLEVDDVEVDDHGHHHQPEPAASTNSGRSDDGSDSRSRNAGGVNSGASLTSYEAVVWEKAWEGFRRLTSFGPADLS